MRKKHGFTLVELMIVVSIIGLLSAIALPSLLQSRKRAQVNRFVADVRVAAGAFHLYAIENIGYPPDTTPSVMPQGMETYLKNMDWTGTTPLGGQWDWDYRVFNVVAGVSVYRPTASIDQLEMVDRILDNGDLSSGNFRQRTDGYIYVLEE